jgi:nucleotide-binding universal stress UspA family protein
MIKRILVPLDPSPFADAALEVACYLAKQHQAQLAGLVILDIPGIEKSVGPVPVGALYYAERSIADKERQTEERIRGLLDRFKQTCQREGVAHLESERQGSPSKRIIEESYYYDCLVMGLRNYFRFDTGAGEDQQYGTPDDRTGRSIEQVMDHSAVPIVAVPMGWHIPERKLRTVVALDGSLPAIRALHSLVQLFQPSFVEVKLISSCDEMADGRFWLDEATAYLAAHNFTEVDTEWTSVALRRMLGAPDFVEADLIVLGAHSQAGFVDFVVGNVCKELIERGNNLLLISH